MRNSIVETAGNNPQKYLPALKEAGIKVIHKWSCGMVVGLIHDIPSCEQLIDRIMGEAEGLIRRRLEGMLH